MKENEFKQFELSSDMIETLSILGYVKPTKIQTLVIPEILKENHIVAMSQTGSGKTAAFAIPLCECINWEENLPQALVLEPTRELAYQVKEEIFQIGRKKRLKVPLLYGGFSFDKQDFTLRQKSHIVVGTPGRVLEHLEAGTCKSS